MRNCKISMELIGVIKFYLLKIDEKESNVYKLLQKQYNK